MSDLVDVADADPLQLAEMVEQQVIEDRQERNRHEPDHVFHPSMLGYCRRVMYDRAAGLTQMDRYVQGVMHVGTRHHHWLEQNVPELHADRHFDTEVSVDRQHVETGIVIKGTADVIDSRGVIYDHKFTGGLGWVEDAPKDSHVRQVTAYMYAAGTDTAQIEYHQRNGKLERGRYVCHPVAWDRDRFDDMMDRAADVLAALQDAEDRDGGRLNNPFPHCNSGEGCYHGHDEWFVDGAVEHNDVICDECGEQGPAAVVRDNDGDCPGCGAEIHPGGGVGE